MCACVEPGLYSKHRYGARDGSCLFTVSLCCVPVILQEGTEESVWPATLYTCGVSAAPFPPMQPGGSSEGKHTGSGGRNDCWRSVGSGTLASFTRWLS